MTGQLFDRHPVDAGTSRVLSNALHAGIVSAVKKGTAWDYGANLFALWGISTPNFWLGIMLIFLFSIELGWLPASGYVPLFENWRASLASTIMPAFVLGNAIAAILMRHTRSAILQVLESDYVRTARAKGLSERAVFLKHAMRSALTPVITLVRCSAQDRCGELSCVIKGGLRKTSRPPRTRNWETADFVAT
jgi:ABC-type dipeptide/oligopeptide/nickel transport system permease component